MAITFYKMQDWSGAWVYIVNVFKNDNLMLRMAFDTLDEAQRYIYSMQDAVPSLVIG